MIRLFESKETDVKLIDLAIKEFEHLKVEARDAITESRLIELNSLVASAAVWAWLFSQLNTVPFHEYIKYIPLILCALGSLRSYALHARLRRISEYICNLENRFENGALISWESRLAKQPWTLTYISAGYWLIVILINGIEINFH